VNHNVLIDAPIDEITKQKTGIHKYILGLGHALESSWNHISFFTFRTSIVELEKHESFSTTLDLQTLRATIILRIFDND
jgi:lysozyme family protein